MKNVGKLGHTPRTLIKQYEVEFKYTNDDGYTIILNGVPAKILSVLLNDVNNYVKTYELITHVWLIGEDDIRPNDLLNLNSHLYRVNKFIAEMGGIYEIVRQSGYGVKLINTPDQLKNH